MRARQAFTFLEIVCAIALLSVVMLPIIQSGQAGIRLTGFNIHRVTATMLSNQLMERFRTQPYDTLEQAFGAGDVPLNNPDGTGLYNTDLILSGNGATILEPFRKLTRNYQITGSFSDVCGDRTLGLLSFTVKWKTARDAPESSLSLGKVVINYKKFGIVMAGPTGSALQSGALDVASLNERGSTNATASTPPPPPDAVTSATGPANVPRDPFTLINTYG